MSMPSPAAFIDHTLLKPTTTAGQIETLCDEAVEYAFASVCIPPCHVPLATRLLYGSAVKVCSVVGFPCGYNSSRSKLQEAVDLLAAGAQELDMVIALGALLEGRHAAVEEEIAQLVLAARDVPLKVIIECCWLSDQLKRQATELVVRAGAAFVKTSTGFAEGGATLADVQLLSDCAGGRIQVKASAGIRTLAECQAFLAAGASRIGTSSSLTIMHQWQQQQQH